MADKSFYCKALQGHSDYNICINSDMTVSCNCQDYDGSGQIGSLEKQTFKEIFFGDIATRFRKMLFDGGFPIPICQNCSELRRIDSPLLAIPDLQVPHQGIMVENTVLCNLRCDACRRDQLLKTRKQVTMSLENIRKVASIIRDHSIQLVYFFNLGEPFLAKNVLDQVSVVRGYNPELPIHTSTNGMLLHTDDKIRAALMMDLIYFSIDGASEATVTQYQKGGSFHRAYENMANLVKVRNHSGSRLPLIEWKYVVFRWNDSEREVERAISLADEAQVDAISFWQGGGTLSQVSKRFPMHRYFECLGAKSWKGREVNLRVTRDDFVQAVLQRLDPAGWRENFNRLKSGNNDLAGFCAAFVDKDGQLSDSQYVVRSYQKLLGRKPDEQASRVFAEKLGIGSLNRSDLILHIINSREFNNRNPFTLCAFQSQARDRATHSGMTRAQIAEEIIKARYGQSFKYRAEPFFVDVPEDHPQFRFIQRFGQEKLTMGFSEDPAYFGPDALVTRYMLATFLVRARHGESFRFPNGPLFDDVPPNHKNFRYVQKAAAEGVFMKEGTRLFHPEDVPSVHECKRAVSAAISRIALPLQIIRSVVRPFHQLPTIRSFVSRSFKGRP